MDGDSGLESTSIAGDIVVSCQQGDLAQAKRFAIRIVEPKEPHKYQPGDNARIELSVQYKLGLGNYANACDSGWTLTEIRGDLAAYVQNTLGGMVVSNPFRFAAYSN